MGSSYSKKQDTVPLAQFNMSENYQPQVGANDINQYSINSNYSAANVIHNSQQVQQQSAKVHNEQQSIPNIPPIPQIPTQSIQIGIPVIQQLEIVQIPQQPLTDDLKDQPFHIKKIEIIKALITYLIMQIISLGLSIFLFEKFIHSKTLSNLAPAICIISGICNFLIIISGKFQKFQKSPEVIIKSFLIVILQGILIASYLFFQASFVNRNSDWYIYLFLILIFQQLVNCIVIGITICYLVFEQKEIRIQVYFLMLFITGLLTILMNFYFIFNVCAAFFFGIILMVVLQQLMNGRFQLKKDQTFGICNAIYLGLMVPCNIF